MTSYRQRLEAGVHTAAAATEPAAPAAPVEPDDDNGDDLYATSGAIAAATQYGIDINTISGTGKDGRITKPDVEAAVELAAETG